MQSDISKTITQKLYTLQLIINRYMLNDNQKKLNAEYVFSIILYSNQLLFKWFVRIRNKIISSLLKKYRLENYKFVRKRKEIHIS